MFEQFFPSTMEPSAYEIDYEGMYQHGCRGIIYDIDNTLVPHGAPADERAEALFVRLKEIGYEFCLISNNGPERVNLFNQQIGARTVSHAHKPSPENYRKAMELMGTDENSTVVIGDQIFTDIWGANRAGLPSILVHPIHPREEIQIVFKRRLEKVVLFVYRRNQTPRAPFS